MHCATLLVLAAALAAIVSCNTISASSDAVQRRDNPDYARAGRVDLGDAGESQKTSDTTQYS